MFLSYWKPLSRYLLRQLLFQLSMQFSICTIILSPFGYVPTNGDIAVIMDAFKAWRKVENFGAMTVFHVNVLVNPKNVLLSFPRLMVGALLMVLHTKIRSFPNFHPTSWLKQWEAITHLAIFHSPGLASVTYTSTKTMLSASTVNADSGPFMFDCILMEDDMEKQVGIEAVAVMTAFHGWSNIETLILLQKGI